MEKLVAIREKYTVLKNVSEEIYRTLDEAIVTGVLRPGERLQESELADVLLVSRTPIREALKKLVADDMVVYTQQGGVSVKEYTDTEVVDIIQALEVLRQITARMAAPTINDMALMRLRAVLEEITATDPGDYLQRHALNSKFHMVICESTGNALIIDFYKKLMKKRGIIQNELKLIRSYNLSSDEEHGRIYEALKKRDPDAAFTAAVVHSEKAYDQIKNLLDNAN